MAQAKVRARQRRQRAAHAAAKRLLRHQPVRPLSARDWRLFREAVEACRQLHQLVEEMESRRRYKDERLSYFDLWASNVLHVAGITRLHWRPRRTIDRMLDPDLFDAYVEFLCTQTKEAVRRTQ